MGDTVNNNLHDDIKEAFNLPNVDIRTYSPLTLAFIGDDVYDIVIRTLIVGRGNTKASVLHKESAKLVKAAAQSSMVDVLLETFTEEEQAIYKRGRNAKSPTMAKNASMIDYRKATGLEAVVGYLYLKGNMARVLELIKLGLESIEDTDGRED